MTTDEDETDSVVWPLRAYLAGCGDEATLPEQAGVGPDPKRAPPR
jgi:hypothetical protein